ncbi:PREDICTED: membrane-associated guanylate kinase, WW and PDZ domain-containing protein 2-like [Cyprinodon variegatus]|uniref:membrane-associated guanylate kinase, WW and PDZ domain-containing protein 2-like n=1 Tax=Cyprinodon variegatus TaxID=28743 RepID=UPI0007426A88|nr:PREDICTED: membrane-associated guanylate kinase, WW and PDZ domain-containing protein 2-like [Cyprinodon variegatus]
MSKSLKKRKNHWTNRVHESFLCRNEEGALGLELQGGAERGQFPVIGALLPGRSVCHSGKLLPEDLLLEVNDTPVAGLTTRDVHAVVKHSKDPVRLKCVKQGESEALQPPHHTVSQLFRTLSMVLLEKVVRMGKGGWALLILCRKFMRF